MVLHHVLERAGAVVVAGAALEGERLLPEHLDLLDVLAVPERLERRGSAGAPSRFCTVAMPRTWSTRKIACSPASPTASASSRLSATASSRSSPNGFSSTIRLPRRQARSPQALDGGREQTRRQRQVGGHGRARAVDHGGDTRRVGDVDRPVAQRAQQRLARRRRNVGGVLGQALGDASPERLVVQVLPGRAHDGEAFGEPVRGDAARRARGEEAAGEVAGGTEEHEPLDHGSPGELANGQPPTPTAARNSEPASGSSPGSSPSREVVMKSSSSLGPPNVQAVTLRAGSSITSSSAPSGRVAAHRAAVGERDPDAALRVDGQPVGPGLRVSANGRRPVRPGVAVVVEDVDAERRRVVVVGERAVRAPLEPVRDGDARRARRATEPSGSSRYSAPRARPLVVGHRAAVEAPVGVAAALVHPHALVAPELVERGERPVGLLEREAALDADHRAAAAAGPNRGAMLADVPALDRAVGRQRRGRRRPACRPSAGRPSAATTPAPRRGRRPRR